MNIQSRYLPDISTILILFYISSIRLCHVGAIGFSFLIDNFILTSNLFYLPIHERIIRVYLLQIDTYLKKFSLYVYIDK